MDFSFGEEHEALRDLAREILGAEVTLDLLKQIEAGDEWFAAALWKQLAESNLLGVAVPEEHGGMGFGVLELVALLHEVGRTVAPLPALPTLVLGALPIARYGTDAQKQRWLPGVASGETILSGALVDAESREPTAPATRARRDGDAWVLDGAKRFVPAVGLSARVLVPALTDGGVGLFLVDPKAAGVTAVGNATSTHEPLFELTLAGVRVPDDDVLGGDARGGAEWLRWIHDAALVATCALQMGVSERAIEIAAGYVKQREQFGAPIGALPAVQHRLADCYIDLEAMRWCTWRAAWRVAEDRPASREAAIAKFWAAEAGSRIANATQHLHGGQGVDREYPSYRYLLWSKALELSLGGGTPQLARLGRDMARTGPQELL